jgi:YbgC/YbaW family acyl-CoA thioester hydrolase
MPFTFATRRRVEFADTDMAGIVHFARFFAFMEAAEHEALRSRGLSVVMTLDGRKLAFPRVAAQCDFYRPLRFEEVVEIQVTLSRLGDKSLTWSFDFVRDGELLARGSITTCCCQVGPEGMIPVAIPPAIRRRLEPADDVPEASASR